MITYIQIIWFQQLIKKTIVVDCFFGQLVVCCFLYKNRGEVRTR